MRYWLGLGANLGDRGATLQAAIDALAGAGIEVEAVSRVYETAPREVEDQPPFLNAACRVQCDADPPGLLVVLKRIEHELGRVAGPRFGPRAIDLDILMWEGGSWTDDAVQVPHPRLVERRFAMVPVLDLDPEITMPDGIRLREVTAALEAADQDVEATPLELAVTRR